jgi:uncharacterized SAM-binding protein YcdF (DUF218 family)
VRRVLVVVGGLVAAWLVACAVLFVWPPAETGAPRHADAVVVLSGDHRRLAPAEALIRRGVSGTLVLSSTQKTPRWQAARALCRSGRYGRARVLCIQAQPYSTRGEAETFSRVAATHRWRSLVVVSSTYHLTRSRMLFRRCYRGRMSLVGAPSTWWRLPEEWASETVKLTVQTLFERSC